MKIKMIDCIKKLGDKFLIPFRRLKRFNYKLSRSSRWFVRMWNNHDWDFDYLIEMMVWKMKDMRNQFDNIDIEYVDLRHQPKEFSKDCEETIDCLKGLDEAIEIGERILKNNYIQLPEDVEKWKKEHGIFSNDKMPDDLHKKMMDSYDLSDEKESKDRKKFFNIISKEHKKWWS